MSPLDHLKEILHPGVLVMTDDPERTIVKLKEENKHSKTGEISLRLPPDSIVFRLDMENNKDFSKKSPFLNESTKNIHGGCDYVVFCHYQEKYWFVLIELKSNDTSGAETQFCCSTVFIRYLRELIFARNQEPVRYELTCLLFSTASRLVKKMPTNPRNYQCSLHHNIKNNLSCYEYAPLPHFNLTQLLDHELQTNQPTKSVDLFNRPRCHRPATTPQARLT